MEKRQVRIHFTLAGRCHKNKHNVLSMDGQEAHECMLSQIRDHFGNRAVYMPHQVELAASRSVYPQYYAAGWFVSDHSVDEVSKTGSDLVVVAHGENLREAHNNMMRAIIGTPWDEVASNISQ